MPEEKNKDLESLNEQIHNEKQEGKVVTAEEINFLQEKGSKLHLFDLEKTVKTKKEKDSGHVYNVGFNGSELGFVAETILAIWNLYERHFNEHIVFDSEGRAHHLTNKQFNDPHSFIAHNWENLIDNNVPKKIVSYIQGRWQEKKYNISQYNDIILSYLSNTEYQIDPFMRAVELAEREIVLGKRKKINKYQFRLELSRFIEDDDKEPYRDRTIDLIRKAPIIIRNSDYTGEGIQNMPIFVGHQGLGKSTLCKYLALGYVDTIKDVSKTDLEMGIKRQDNVILESAELSEMKKSEKESLKASITVRSIKTQMKYHNEISTFECRALIVGTTNDHDFLKDNTGERRFLPINLKSWNKNVLTYDYMLSVYGTCLHELLSEGNYHDLRVAREQIKLDKYKVFKKYGTFDEISNEYKENKLDSKTLDDIQRLNEDIKKQKKIIIEKSQKQNDNEFNLNVIETSEDLAYKEAHFGQVDPLIEKVKEVLINALTNNTDLQKAILWGINERNHEYVFKVKSVLEKEISKEVEKLTSEKPINIYIPKITNWILSLGEEGSSRINGYRHRGILIQQDKLNKVLDLSSDQVTL